MASPKGFDKEYIFNLIMPSASEPETEAEEPAPEPSPQPKAEPEPEEAPDSLSLLREQLNRPVSPVMQLRPGKNLVLVNLAEQLVADRLEAVFEKFNCCRCDKCRHDVAALALNTVQSQYVVTTLEEIPALLEAADTREIPGALVKAILHVKNHPKH